MNREKLKAQLKQHEGVRKYVYIDSVGVPTVGVGRNLQTIGLRPKEIDFLLENDIDDVMSDITKSCPWFAELSEARQIVIADMVFNLGISRFLEFKRTLAAIRAEHFDAAADNMLESKWARQVGKAPGQRAAILAQMMRAG